MRQTFSDLQTLAQNATGQDTSATTLTFLKQRINARYETVLNKLPSHFSEITKTFSTVDDQQYYHYPPNLKEIEELYITIGSVKYDLTPVLSYSKWIELNAILFQAGAIPERFFKRQRDFGIWPIPQGAYTATLTYSIRASGMVYSDYTTGTVAVTENDATVTGTTTAFNTGTNVTADIMWFCLADTNGEPRGDWYRIASVTNDTSLELESVFEGSTASAQNYIIGESPELPEELHEILAYGAVADYYASFRQSIAKAKAWSNMFHTGDWGNESRDFDKKKVSGGLIGFLLDYKDRHKTQLVKRRRTFRDARDKVFATTIS